MRLILLLLSLITAGISSAYTGGSHASSKREDIDRLIKDTARRHSTPHLSQIEFVHLIKAVITIESAWDPKARSHAGARGLMQVMPVAEQEAFWLCQITIGDVYLPRHNLEVGICILRRNINLSGGNLVQALAQYNGGYRALDRVRAGQTPPLETVRYIVKVLNIYYEGRGK